MSQSHFFAHLSRLKLINRWPLMRNVRTENVSEHSLQVAMVAHALAAIKNRKFNGQVNAERIALLAMYHDASEVLTGDLPTPVKYFNSQIAQEYKAIEKIAQQKLIDMVPEELRDIFGPLIDEHQYTEEEKSLVKQADALCAYLKCLEELSAGNNEFLLAKTRLEKTLES
ncbi:TPA: 5'-deoxynucleotidase, partial [Enterobacter hormaechei subsp. xiangfangensis]|nr:5'-deoxynucleotidase [Enterobacter hormaechei subsp. xiangfangensis]